mmetsp:Transcript_10373/g.15156  ORF Transcript_10373/g.15156 Transcript_10373/m.15156 type:complete len:260 (+) Transcript_10373:62-841(+)|eukprot:CAMPEP_0197247276 /NCGR_PEP_ID=MMETSP1429-20130617/27727_1 /TAXON_ID=49237 /ORGANISM="Chaetoceros  sp., Strain UNC1202" /LENGTH=259 /DNA_ID=CAMNT_0042708147 /DNA_START=62 /DNA_END=838 /DNA_ORIENTATION=+
MAPNLHESSSFHSLCSLDLSNHVLTSKFSLLVPPQTVNTGATNAVPTTTIPALLAPLQPQTKVQARATPEKNEESDSYWFVPADDECDYFSSSYLEESLVKDAQRRETKAENIEANHAKDSAVASYWDWADSDTQDKDCLKVALIQKILKEEAIRQMLTSENIAAKESEYHRTKGNVPQVDASDDTNHEYSSHDYFFFPQPAECKKDIIERILREEELRQTLLTENIVKNLIRDSEEQKEEVPLSRAQTVGSGQSYWDW